MSLRLQVDLDREAVLELVEFRGVQGGARVVLGQGLLGGADDPDLAVADVLEVLGEALQVEDQVLVAADVLADLVDDEEMYCLPAVSRTMSIISLTAVIRAGMKSPVSVENDCGRTGRAPGTSRGRSRGSGCR